MRHACAVSLMTATLLLSGCSDDRDPPDARSTSTPSGTIATPSTSAEATPTEPPLPDAATKATEAGARAFITYYWDLINYAQVTGDVKALKRSSSDSCEGCNQGVRAIRDLYEADGYIVGGAYTITISDLRDLESDSDLYAFEALLTTTSQRQIVHRGDGTTHESKPGTGEAAVAARWSSDSWLMEVMDPR